MAVVVIGGHSRDLGKTSVVAGVIAALPEFEWNAFKITQYGHGICSKDGASCHCASEDHSWAISQENDRTGKTDTSRFLLAGATRVWWVRTEQGRLAEAMPAIRRRLDASRNAILESNSVLKFILPDLYLTILDPATADFKRSAQEFLDRADAVIIHQQRFSNSTGSAWGGVSLKPLQGCPQFAIEPPQYVTPELVNFVRQKLTASNRVSQQ